MDVNRLIFTVSHVKFLNVQTKLIQTGRNVTEMERKGRRSGCEIQSQHSHSPVLSMGFLLQLCPFSPSPNLSQKILSSSPTPSSHPQDLFMETESLNPSSLYSSEAARWQLLMSMLMTLPRPGEHSEHICTAGAQRPRCQQS